MLFPTSMLKQAIRLPASVAARGAVTSLAAVPTTAAASHHRAVPWCGVSMIGGSVLSFSLFFFGARMSFAIFGERLKQFMIYNRICENARSEKKLFFPSFSFFLGCCCLRCYYNVIL